MHTLKGTLRGELIEPGDPAYDEARKVYNGMIDKRPRAIAKCADVADVVACVQAGLDRQIPVAIRGGGHNAGGLGICDDGLVIDMALLNRVQVDAKAHTVRVGGGALWRDVDKATHEVGQAVPTGIISTTGVGGLSLGGGIGHLTRKCGADDRQHPRRADGAGRRRNDHGRCDAQRRLCTGRIRGGGGNFGVVTEFTFRIARHPHRHRGTDVVAAGSCEGNHAVVP